MSLEDRIRSSLDSAVDHLRSRIEHDVRTVADQLVAAAAEEREAALADARRIALDEVAQDVQRQVAEVEAQARATIDGMVASARAEEREQTAAEVRRIVEVEGERKLGEALATAEQRMKLSLADAEARAEQALQDSVAAARVRERELEMAAFTRLLESVRGLDGAASLSEVLDALGQAAGREAGRAAVLVLRNERLLGWRLTGFGPRDSQPKTIDLGLNECGVIGLAVGTARPVTTRDSDTASAGPGFAHLPADRMGLAVPVIVGGRVVAVVYADSVVPDGKEHVVPSGWPEVIEILARHAARVLEALTVQKVASPPSPRFWVPPSSRGHAPQATGHRPSPENAGVALSMSSTEGELPEDSARRIARLLLSDLKMSHEPAVEEGRRARNLLARLGPEIDRARRDYDARVPVTLKTRADLFHQELVATLAGGDSSLLGAPA
jgi:hypothetical protein